MIRRTIYPQMKTMSAMMKYQMTTSPHCESNCRKDSNENDERRLSAHKKRKLKLKRNSRNKTTTE